MIREFNGKRPKISKSAFISEGAYVVGDVEIGMNATLLHDVTIGSFCIIAAASLVRQGMKILDFSLVRGAPAKIIGRPTEKQLLWVKGGNKKYVDLANRYKAEGL